MKIRSKKLKFSIAAVDTFLVSTFSSPFSLKIFLLVILNVLIKRFHCYVSDIYCALEFLGYENTETVF